MTTHIDVSVINQGSIGDPAENKRYLKYAIDFGTDPLQFDFPSGAAQLLTFGVPRCIFIDNQNNLYSLNVTVSTTNQSFPVPAQSAGYYYIDAVVGSSITVTPASDPTGVVTFVFYNFDRSPVVWYKTNVSESAVTIANGADVALGATTDAAVTNPALAATVVSVLKGILDNTGGGGSTGPNVNLSKVAGNTAQTGHGTAANTLRVELPTDGTGKVGLNAGAAIIGKVGIDQTAGQNVVVTDGDSFNNINSATTTVVKGAAGTLKKVIVNTGAAGTATIYNNTAGSGAVIAIVDTTNPVSLDFNIDASVGITVVTSAAADVTVSYR